MGDATPAAPSDVTVVMAYSDDYTIGTLCESVNKMYAARYNYKFISSVLPCDEILGIIHPKMHVTWYKIYLLRKLMREIMLDSGYTEEDLLEIATRASSVKENNISEKKEEFSSPSEREVMKYLFWIDGDALVSYQDLPVEQILLEGQYRELIIAEDMHKLNPVNAGVFLLRVCPWSMEFLESTWQNTRYDATFYYEQSAMTKAIRNRKQGLYYVRPFHSFDGGPQDVKIFPNVSVFPLALFSSNILVSTEESEEIVQKYEEALMSGIREQTNGDCPLTVTAGKQNLQSVEFEQFSASISQAASQQRPLYIFHAAGMKSKLNVLKAAIIKYNIPCPMLGGNEWLDMSFKLLRSNLGHVVDLSNIPLKVSNRKQSHADDDR